MIRKNTHRHKAKTLVALIAEQQILLYPKLHSIKYTTHGYKVYTI